MKENHENAGIQETGIRELDTILGGGIPLGHVVLLAGGSGSGKTLFAMQYLFAGFKRFQEAGIYITLTEPVSKALKNIRTIEFYDENVTNPLQVHFTDLRSMIKQMDIEGKEIDKDAIDKIISVIANLVEGSQARRLVIDSITAMCYFLKTKDLIRYFIFKLGATLSNFDCTSLLTSEVVGDGFSIFGVEEFISDGIINMKQTCSRNELLRTFQIVKMRGIEYHHEIHHFKIDKNGVNIFLKIRSPLTYTSSNERIKTGVVGLDDMCDGGIFRGSGTLIAGSTGTGKSLMCLHFIMEGIRENKPSLYVGLEESRGQLLRNARGYGWDLEDYEKQGLLFFITRYPEEAAPIEHLDAIRRMVEEKGIERCVVDSLSSIGNVFREEDFLAFTKNLVSYLKLKEVSAFFTAATASLMGTETITESHLSTITDNIFLLKYVEVGGGLKLMIVVLKTRGSDHDKALREYEITNAGLVIGSALSAFEGVMTGSTRKIGKTTEEKLKEEFTDTLGPMGQQAFEEVSSKGITDKTISDYVDSLVSDSIMKEKDAQEFRQRIRMILNGG